MQTLKLILTVLIILALVPNFYIFPPSTPQQTTSIEETMSRRMSVRNYTSENLTNQQLLDILQIAYGYVNDHRSTPEIGYDHSLTIYPVNATGSYRYAPELHSLIVHDLSVNKETIRSHDQGWPSDSSVVLVVVWNSTKMNNGYLASAEAGCLVQNVYLTAAYLDLGTCCVGGISSSGLRDDLHLSSDLIPLLVMPFGYPVDPYPPSSPDYDIMTGNLPPVEYSQLSYEESLQNIELTQNWSNDNLSLQELSQLLWAAYGYTNTSHRTTPDSYGIYSLNVFVSNSSGIYQYLPPNHSVHKTQDTDRRFDIASACSNQLWAANAPSIFLITYNSSYNNGNTGDGGTLPHEFMEVNSGAVIQQLILESSAWNLSANLISDGLETWNGTGAQDLRTILNLPPSQIPLYVLPIGHKTTADQHDVAITNIHPSKSIVGEGYGLHINITVANLGQYEEEFTLTLYANSSIINSTTQVLPTQTSEVVNIFWNINSFNKGNYSIWATASPVPNETNTVNNDMIDGWIFVTIAGDFDADRDVDIFDIVLIAVSYGSSEGDPSYDSNLDCDNNGKINIYDVVVAAFHYGSSW